MRAMARSPAERFASAAELAAVLQAWLHGSKRKEEARAVVTRAEAKQPEAAALRKRAAELRRRDGGEPPVLDVVFVLAAEVGVGDDLRGGVDQIGPGGEASCKINTTSV